MSSFLTIWESNQICFANQGNTSGLSSSGSWYTGPNVLFIKTNKTKKKTTVCLTFVIPECLCRLLYRSMFNLLSSKTRLKKLTYASDPLKAVAGFVETPNKILFVLIILITSHSSDCTSMVPCFKSVLQRLLHWRWANRNLSLVQNWTLESRRSVASNLS